jgi:hypothetical protein
VYRQQYVPLTPAPQPPIPDPLPIGVTTGVIAVSPDEIRLWLEWAGSRLLSLPSGRLYPQSFRSFWPNYPDDVHTAFGYTNTSLRPNPPPPEDIAIMDAVFDLVLLVDRVTTRRILQARALVSPINGRYLFHWTTIAVILSSNRRAVAAEHGKGLEKIAAVVAPVSVAHFRNSINSPLTSIPLSAQPIPSTAKVLPSQ